MTVIMRRIFHLFIIALSLIFVVSTADAACPRVPENNIWGQVGVGAIARHVDQAHKGYWAPYVQKWESRLTQIEDIQKRGVTLVFHDTNQWLRGETLVEYVDDVRVRVAVTRCLARAALKQKTPGEAVAGLAIGGGS